LNNGTRHFWRQAAFESNLCATFRYHVSCFEFGSPSPQKVAVANCPAALECESERNLLTTRNKYHMLAAGGELLSISCSRAGQAFSLCGDRGLMQSHSLPKENRARERDRP
jgi:hypothetical protein